MSRTQILSTSNLFQNQKLFIFELKKNIQAFRYFPNSQYNQKSQIPLPSVGRSLLLYSTQTSEAHVNKRIQGLQELNHYKIQFSVIDVIGMRSKANENKTYKRTKIYLKMNNLLIVLFCLLKYEKTTLNLILT